jgi:hypothetical protein
MDAYLASRLSRLFFFSFFSLVLFYWGSAVVFAAGTEKTHHISSEVCKNCHKEIYKQWKGSMHAQSTALKDPIHATFYKKVAGDPTKEGVKHKASGKFPICLQCHAPNAAVDKTTKLDAKPAYAEGVNCVACHTLATFKGTKGKDGKMLLGLKAYGRSDKIQGPQGFNQELGKLTAADDMFGGMPAEDDSKPNPHTQGEVEIDGKKIPALPMDGNPGLMKTNAACMGCHDKRNNPHGVPLCQTGNEYAGSNVNCQSCHMPIAGGMADHGMTGGHGDAMLKRSVVFTLDSSKQGDRLKTTVTLKNMQPHSLPTGAPFRNIYMKLPMTVRVIWYGRMPTVIPLKAIQRPILPIGWRMRRVILLCRLWRLNWVWIHVSSPMKSGLSPMIFLPKVLSWFAVSSSTIYSGRYWWISSNTSHRI